MTSSPAGPAPVRTDRPRAAALRVLRALVSLEQPAELPALLDVLGGHPNTVRAQLDLLVGSGFVEVAPAAVTRRGRPPKRYQVTLAGSQVALEDPERDDHLALIEAVADQLGEGPDPHAAALALGRRWGERLQASRGDAADVAAVLGSQGFTPVPTDDGLLLRTCPPLVAAGRRPDVICTIHQGLLDALTDGRATLHPFAGRGGCAITLQPDDASTPAIRGTAPDLPTKTRRGRP